MGLLRRFSAWEPDRPEAGISERLSYPWHHDSYRSHSARSSSVGVCPGRWNIRRLKFALISIGSLVRRRATCEPHLSSTYPSGPNVCSIPTSDCMCRENLSKATISPLLISGESITAAIRFKATWCGNETGLFKLHLIHKYLILEKL